MTQISGGERMTENHSLESAENTTEQQPAANLTSQLFKSEKGLDVCSMIQLATTLMKNETLINSVTDKIKQKPSPKVLADREKTELIEFAKELEKISENIQLLLQKTEIIKSELEEIKNVQKKYTRPNRFKKFLTLFKR